MLFFFLFLLFQVYAKALTNLEGTLNYYKDHSIGTEYTLNTIDDKIYQLSFNNTSFRESDIIKWLKIRISGNYDTNYVVIVTDVLPLSSRPGLRAGPPILKTLTFFINSLCNRTTDLTLLDIKKRWYKSYGSTSLEGLYETCSLGKTLFPESNNLILDGIDMPCSGTMKSGPPWDANKCGMTEVYGWQEYAENIAISRGIDTKNYQQRIMLLPSKGLNCPWGGLGSIGCRDKCFVWINMNKGTQLSTIAHETGHTLGLLHSNTPSAEYGDYSCIMGISGQACYNSVQSWKLKWHDALFTINMNNMSDSNTYIIPSHMAAYNTFIRIIDVIGNSYFISYRLVLDPFENSLRDLNNVLSIHTTNGTVTEITPSVLLGKATLTQPYLITQLGITVKFLGNINTNFAKVLVCRNNCDASSGTPPPSPPPPPKKIPSPPPPKKSPSPPPPPPPKQISSPPPPPPKKSPSPPPPKQISSPPPPPPPKQIPINSPTPSQMILYKVLVSQIISNNMNQTIAQNLGCPNLGLALQSTPGALITKFKCYVSNINNKLFYFTFVSITNNHEFFKYLHENASLLQFNKIAKMVCGSTIKVLDNVGRTISVRLLTKIHECI